MASVVEHFIAHRGQDDPYTFSWPGYLSAAAWWDFDVWIEIYEEPIGNIIGEIRCAFPAGASAAVNITSRGPSIGGGFYNFAGITWPVPLNGIDYYPLADGDPANDSQSYGEANIIASSNQSDFFTDHMIAGVWCCDADPYNQAGWYVHAGSSWSRPLYTDDLNSQGNLENVVIASVYQRGFDIPNGRAQVTVGVPITASMGVDWSYFPWAIRKNGIWMSADRSDHGLQIVDKDSHVWRNVKNYTMISSGQSNKGFTMKNSSWRRSYKIGNMQ